MAAVGVVVLLIALWLGSGESQLQRIPDDPAARAAALEAVLARLPGHPAAQRALAEIRLVSAVDEAMVVQFQADVDALPRHMSGFAPNLVSLAAHSLAQAERTGRTELRWEDAMLTEAEQRLPAIPSLVAERLHWAVLTGDAAAIREALPDAQRWGAPYPYTSGYISKAVAVLGAAEGQGQ